MSDNEPLIYPTVSVTKFPKHWQNEHFNFAFNEYEFDNGGFKIIFKSLNEVILMFETVEAATNVLDTFMKVIPSAPDLSISPYRPTNSELELWSNNAKIDKKTNRDVPNSN